jgi:hypothetical protein
MAFVMKDLLEYLEFSYKFSLNKGLGITFESLIMPSINAEASNSFL